MNFIGIDPGINGGIAVLSNKCEVLDKIVMPVNKNAKELDFAEAKKIFSSYNKVTHDVFLERIIPFALNSKATISFGKMIGSLEFLLWVLGMRVTHVEASKWTREIHQGIDSKIKAKVKSEIAVKRLFPEENFVLPGCKKSHDGLIDAVLIAEYGRRLFLKGKY